MGRKKKRKMNLFLIILVIILIFSLFIIVFRKELKAMFTPKETNETNGNNKVDEKPDPYLEYKKTSNFKLVNIDRYVVYKTKYANLPYEDIVTRVNIGLDKEFYSYISDANTNKGVLLLMNKYLRLAKDYEPSDIEDIPASHFISGNLYVRGMRKVAKEAFIKMIDQANTEGYTIYGQSGFRPYSMQENLYNSAVKNMGLEKADLDTARPGHSEHQTGLTIDVSSTKGGNMLSFENTESFTWMQKNAHKFGFILRYPKDKTNITGFMYESWHYRYVGTQVATDMYNNYKDLTYDEYYYRFIDNK